MLDVKKTTAFEEIRRERKREAIAIVICLELWFNLKWA